MINLIEINIICRNKNILRTSLNYELLNFAFKDVSGFKT